MNYICVLTSRILLLLIQTFYGVILWSLRVLTIEICLRFVFYNNTEIDLFLKKARALRLTSFLLSAATSQ